MEIQAQFSFVCLLQYIFLVLACSALPSATPYHKKSVKPKHPSVLETTCLCVGQLWVTAFLTSDY